CQDASYKRFNQLWFIAAYLSPESPFRPQRPGMQPLQRILTTYLCSKLAEFNRALANHRTGQLGVTTVRGLDVRFVKPDTRRASRRPIIQNSNRFRRTEIGVRIVTRLRPGHQTRSL